MTKGVATTNTANTKAARATFDPTLMGEEVGEGTAGLDSGASEEGVAGSGRIGTSELLGVDESGLSLGESLSSLTSYSSLSPFSSETSAFEKEDCGQVGGGYTLGTVGQVGGGYTVGPVGHEGGGVFMAGTLGI